MQGGAEAIVIALAWKRDAHLLVDVEDSHHQWLDASTLVADLGAVSKQLQADHHLAPVHILQPVPHVCRGRPVIDAVPLGIEHRCPVHCKLTLIFRQLALCLEANQHIADMHPDWILQEQHLI